MVTSHSKKKAFLISLIVFIGVFVIVIFLVKLLIIGFDTKKVIPKLKCSPSTEKLIKVGKVKDVDYVGKVKYLSLYSYCIDKISFKNGTGSFSSEKELLKGTRYLTMVWDGGTRYYRGKNYILIDCQNLSGHLKYIISKVENSNDAWRYCHTEN